MAPPIVGQIGANTPKLNQDALQPPYSQGQFSRAMRKALLLGGTGAMGLSLSRLLSDAEWDVSVTSRSPRTSSEGIRYLQGNATDQQFLTRLLSEQWDLIVDFMVYTTEQFETRCQQLLESTSHYLFLSSARVYADSAAPITEESLRLLDTCSDQAYLSIDEYALSKARQENFLQSASRKNWTIIRPYITYARDRLQLGTLEKESWLYRALRGRSIVFPSALLDRVTTLTSGEDVAKAIALLSGRIETQAQVFQITSSETKTWREILQVYTSCLQQTMGLTPKTKFVALEDFERDSLRIPQIQYDRMFNRAFNPAKLWKFLSPFPFQSPETGLSSCLSDFLQRPAFQEIDWRTEARRDRLTGEVAAWQEFKNAKTYLKYLLMRFVARSI
jgi:nucleoside-diphosphate-sugar epimerase